MEHVCLFWQDGSLLFLSHRLKEWKYVHVLTRNVRFSFLGGGNGKQPAEILQRLSVATNNEENFPDESFFEMLMKCQGSRLEEQRSSLPNEENQAPNGAAVGASAGPNPHHNMPHKQVHLWDKGTQTH